MNRNFEHGNVAIVQSVDTEDDISQSIYPLLLTKIGALHHVPPDIICLLIKAWILQELSLIIFISVREDQELPFLRHFDQQLVRREVVYMLFRRRGVRQFSTPNLEMKQLPRRAACLS